MIFAFESAERCDLGNARHRCQRGLHDKILQRAQFSGISQSGRVSQDVLHHPADAGRIWSQRRPGRVRQPVAYAVQIFEYATARPVQVRAILEHHVHCRESKLTHPAHDLCVRHLEQFRLERIRDLIFDQLWCLTRPLGHHDDLYVREIRDCIDRRAEYRDRAGDGEHDCDQGDHHAMRDRPRDDTCEHDQRLVGEGDFARGTAAPSIFMPCISLSA